MNDNETDVALMSQIAGGNENAVRVFVTRWQRPLINFFYRSVNNVHTAEDLSQETFIRVCRAAQNYVPAAAFSTYLFQIAHNVLVSNFRSTNRRAESLVAPEDLPVVVDNSADLERDVRDLEEALALAVKNLPDAQRTAILLLSQQHFSYDEIAETMQISVGNVKTLIHRARLVLREKLSTFYKK